MIELFAQADTQELAGRLGDGSLIRAIIWCSVGIVIGVFVPAVGRLLRSWVGQ